MNEYGEALKKAFQQFEQALRSLPLHATVGLSQAAMDWHQPLYGPGDDLTGLESISCRQCKQAWPCTAHEDAQERVVKAKADLEELTA